MRLVAFPSQKQNAKAAKSQTSAKRSRIERIDIGSWVYNKDEPEHRHALETVCKKVYIILFSLRDKSPDVFTSS